MSLPGARIEWRKWLTITLAYNDMPSWADPDYFEWLAMKVCIFASGDADLQQVIWAEVEARFGRKVAYVKYLSSGHWHSKRMEKMLSVGFRCEECGATEGLQVYHKTYAHRGAEELPDLVVMCDDCHGAQHHEQAHFGARV